MSEVLEFPVTETATTAAAGVGTVVSKATEKCGNPLVYAAVGAVAVCVVISSGTYAWIWWNRRKAQKTEGEEKKPEQAAKAA